MTEVKNLKVQEEFNSYIWETLYDYSKEKNPDVEMELHQVKTVPQCVCISLKGYVFSAMSKASEVLLDKSHFRYERSYLY